MNEKFMRKAIRLSRSKMRGNCGGTMPENLPVAESIKKVARREKKRLKAGA